MQIEYPSKLEMIEVRRSPLFVFSIIFLSTSASFNPIAYAEEQKVWSHKYISLNVEIHTPYQCYPGQLITVRINVETFENINDISINILIWSSKSEGYDLWNASFFALVAPNLSSGEVRNETYEIGIPSDISPGLTYGIVTLQWSIYREPSWEEQRDQGNFRMTYVKNKNCEDLQTTYNSVLIELQNTRTLIYALLVTTTALAISTVYLMMKKPKKQKTPL